MLMSGHEMIKKNWRLFIILIIIFSFPIFPLRAEVIEIAPPGTIEGQGNSFKITDSKYLNVGLESSEPIKTRIESIPETVMITLESVSPAESTEINLSGFVPLTTYYKYQDDYHNLTEFTADENGSYAYIQDLSEPHLIFIQTRKSTKYIKDDVTGGNCTLIGVWDWPTKTCTLTTDVNETIQIDNDNIILDSNGHEISGYNTGSGIYVNKKNVTLKNLKIKNFSNGIFLYGATYNNLINNIVSYNSIGINIYSASNNFLKNNTAVYNANFGFYIMGSSANNILRNNSMSNNRLPAHGDGYDFYMRSFNYSAFGNDIDTTNTTDGKPIYYVENGNGQTYENLGNIGVFYCIKCGNVTFKNFTIDSLNNETGLYLWKNNGSHIEGLNIDKSNIGIRVQGSNNNIFKDNTISNTLSGISISDVSSGNLFYHNNFINNRSSLWFVNPGSNSLNTNMPIGGNYWSEYDDSLEGCSDSNHDKICDSPRVFMNYGVYYGQDNYPWTKQNGWAEKSLPEKAADLAKEVITAPYLGDGETYGGKGWDSLQNLYVSSGEIFDGYSYWNNKLKKNSFGAGLDCSGLVQWAYNRSFNPSKSLLQNAIRWDSADGQYKHNTGAITENDLQSGDLLFLDKGNDNHIDHVAMYVGENDGYDVVEAFTPRRGIISSIKTEFETRVGSKYFSRVELSPSIGGQIKASSPVDLIVTDPNGFTITPTTTIQTDEEYLNEVPGELYYTESVLGTDGYPEDTVYWPVQKIGDYIIKVIPDSNANPNATYSLDFSAGEHTVNLAHNVPLNQIPSQGYGVSVAGDQSLNPFILVQIDIKPSSYINSINLGSNGVVPVVVFSSIAFNVKNIDIPTVKIGNASIKLKGSGQAALNYSDLNADGFLDVNIKVSTEALQLTQTDTKVNLEGKLIDGTVIKGSGLVRIVP